MRVLIRLSLVFGLLFFPITPAVAETPPPQAAGPALYHKSQAGLMPPAYGAAPAERTLLVAAALHSGGQFAPFTIYPSGAWPEAVAVGEFNGDGRSDAALSASFNWDAENDNRLHLFAQTSGGGLIRAQRLPTGNQPTALAVGDFNRDGRRDVVVANQDDDTLSLFLHTGAGLTATLTLPAGAGPDAVAVGDFNGDLRDDIAVVHAISQTVGIYHQQAAGSFAAPVWLGLSSAGYNDIAVGDLNGDGYDDLVVLRGAGHTVSQVAIFYQQNRALGAPVFRTVEDGGFLAHGLAVGDVTGDGRDDIVVTAGGNAPQAYLSIFVQQPDGTLPLTPAVYAAHHLPEAVAIADVNHDGRNDVVAVHAAWMTLSVYTQTVAGTLSVYEVYPLPYTDYYRPGGLALGDVTGNGGVDVLIANHSSLPAENGLVVLANTGVAPTSTITHPALPTFITDTLVFPIEGLASNNATILEISTDGGRTWAAQSASSAWSYPWEVPVADGSYILLTRATDAAGRVQYPPARSRVIVDRTPPLGSLIINEGAAYTNSPTVTLTVSGSDFNGVEGMRFANADAAFSAWVAFAPAQTWTLSAGDGIKTVRGQVRDVPGNPSVIFSDTIILDTTPPSCNILINEGAPYAISSQVTLTLTAEDANGVAEMRVRNASGDWPVWQAYTLTLPWNLAAADGVRTVEAQFRDIVGNTSAACQDTIILDTTPPVCSAVINGNAPYTTQPTVTLTITGADVNGVAHMRFSHDNVTWTAWEPAASTRLWTLASLDGLRTAYAQVQDAPGNISAACSDSITLDTTSPTGFVIINGGALYTGVPTVTLTLGAADINGVSHMRFSNTGITWAAWQPYDVSASWTLTGGDGLKTVYVQYRDVPGNVSNPYTDTIILDTTPPGGDILINDGATYTNIPTVTLTITATDAIPVTDMRFSHDGATWGDWEAYAATHIWVLQPGDGPKHVYVAFRDAVGNVSEPLADTIILDTTPPTCQVFINGGATYTTDPAVMLNVSCADANPPLQARYSNDGSTWSAWEAYTALQAWTLSGVDGTRTVYVQAQDTPGNISTPVTDTIVLDTTPPSCSLSINDDASYATSPNVVLTLTCNDVNGMNDIRLSNDGSNWEPWRAYATSISWVLPAGDGLKAVYLQGRDVPGNLSVPISDTILLDTTLPSGGCAVMSNNGYVNNPMTTLSLWSYDDNGVPDMQLRNSGAVWGEWIAYTTPYPWTLPSGDGVKSVQCRFRDTPGNISPVYTATVILDMVPPTCQITINDGAAYANDLLVTLILNSTDQYGVSDMRFSNNQSAWSVWQAYAPSRSWTLPEGSGAKTVWAQFRDLAGNVAQCHATITVDLEPPTGNLLLNDGAQYTTVPTITVTLVATDTVSGLDQLCLGASAPCTAWQPYIDTLPWTLALIEDPPQTICAWLKDHAGNVSAPVCADITLDQTPPGGSVVINNGAAYTNNPTVTLVLTASDRNGVTHMRFSHDGATWGDWELYAIERFWPLAGDDGVKSAYVQFRDVAQNVSVAFSDTIWLDTQPPTGTLLINNGITTTAQSSVTLSLMAVDSGSGVCDMQLRNVDAAWHSWQPYSTTVAWDLGPGAGLRTVQARFRDCAGNESPIVMADITVLYFIYLPLALRVVP